MERTTRVASMSLILVLGACGGARTPAPGTPVSAAADGAAGPAEAAVITVEGVGLRDPESVLHDREADVYLVANVAGKAPGDGAAQAGFISRVRPDGTMAQRAWIDGSAAGVTLAAPRGMALVGDTLYVADVRAVRMFDRKTGAPTGAIEIPGATMLDSLAVAPDQTLYVSDTGVDARFRPTGTDAIYRIGADGQVSTLIADPALGQPRGIVATEDAVFAVDWTEGKLRRIGLDGAMTEVATLPANQLDGLARTAQGTFLVSSWGGLAVYRVTAGGQVSTAIEDLQAPAGIGHDQVRNRLLVTLSYGGALRFYPL